MIGDPIDPAPFEPAMPGAVRDAIARARTGSGPAAAWLVARGRGWGQVGTSMTLLRDPKVAPELAGWLAGVAMFGDDTDRIAEALEGHAGAAFALEAFVAGVHAGVPAAAGQWGRIERLASIGRPPASLASVVPIGCASEDAPVRTAAMKLARKLGGSAQAALERARTSAKGTARRRLSAARTTIAPKTYDGDNREALLLRLLDSWRTTRAPELEPPIAALGIELARTRGAIAAKSRSAIEAAWADVAKKRDPIDVDRLLDAPWPKSLDAARKRVEKLARFAPDPRITHKVIAAAKKHRSWQSLRFHRAVAELISETPMPAIVAELDDLVLGHDTGEVAEIYHEARELAVAARPAPPDAHLLDEVRQASGPSRDLAQLWATHVASPGDLAHRAVLADALQLAGDPRGELIALQLAGTRDATAKKRIAELLAGHADVWTGPIPLVSKSSRRFERGFLVAMSCRGAGHELRASFTCPEWVTIEDLFIDGAGCLLAQVVRRMPLLRRLATPHADLLAQLAKSGKYPSIEALACGSGWLPPRDVFPNARVIGGRWIQRSWGPAFATAQADAADLGFHAIVHLGFPLDHLTAALGERTRGPAETRFAIDGDFAGFDSDGWRVRVFRADRTAELAWGGGPSGLKATKPAVLGALRHAFLTVREVKRIDLAG